MEKRQNGRRMKEHNEPSFSLTSQDKHGVAITDLPQAFRIRNIDGQSSALQGEAGGTGAKTGLYNIGTKIRRLTPIECERLQGFPDNWTQGISDSQRYKCLGNAVTTNVITEIIKRMFL